MKHEQQFRQCVRCVLDTDDRAELTFDSAGLCHNCRWYDSTVAALPSTDADRNAAFRATVNRIREAGKHRKYDSILGVSGGVDSSYLAYLVAKEGLRPLVVHFDNGWNSELAVENIHRLVTKLGFDLYTYVIDWEEFRQLQLAYLRASVIDIEALTDHAIFGALYQLAIDHRIPFVLSGGNVASEGVLPYAWGFNKLDYVNIKDIHAKFGRGTIRTYPFVDKAMKRRIKQSGIEVVTLLDYVPYVYADVKETLTRELGWRDYGGKHYESIFTRFYQGYILPTKFGVDKRKAHLSSLICSGQMTKAEALCRLQAPPCDPECLAEDRRFVLKKLGLGDEEFDRLMSEPPRDHREFETEGSFFNYYPALKPLRPLWNVLKRMGLRRGYPRIALA